jgi:branched-chain amino acid transport system permease protein
MARWVRIGLIAGVVCLFVSVIGMVQRFNDRNVLGDAVTLGYVLLGVALALGGYLAGRPQAAPGETAEAAPARIVGMGAGAGLLGGALLAGLIVLTTLVNVRAVFVNVTPPLIDILSFGQGTALGSVLITAFGTILGAAGAGLWLLRARWRRLLVMSLVWVLGVSLLEPFFRVALLGLGDRTGGEVFDSVARFLYSGGGLTWAGAALVFAVAVAVPVLWSRRARLRAEEPDEGERPRPRVDRRTVILIVVALFLILLPTLVGSVLSNILTTVGLFMLMGIGLNIVVGYAGLLDLGYVAFFAVGAYTAALLTGGTTVESATQSTVTSVAHLSFWVALPIVMIVTGLAGVLVGAPVLRLRGDYLAIVTLGFGEIARILAASDWLRPSLGGGSGITRIPDPSPFGFSFRDPKVTYYVIALLCLIAIYVSWRLVSSRTGRAWSAMREDEQVAEAMGVSIVGYKLRAFTTGAVLGGLAGAIFAARIGSVFPVSFDVQVSITVLALIILGGIGSLPGVVVGALVLVGLPELLREFGEFRLLIYGAVLVAVMILRPAGLIPNVRRSRELQEDERAQDAWAQQESGPDLAPAGAAERGEGS